MLKGTYNIVWRRSEDTVRDETEMNKIDEVTSARWEIWGIPG